VLSSSCNAGMSAGAHANIVADERVDGLRTNARFF
jgi:hypothetical protein